MPDMVIPNKPCAQNKLLIKYMTVVCLDTEKNGYLSGYYYRVIKPNLHEKNK